MKTFYVILIAIPFSVLWIYVVTNTKISRNTTVLMKKFIKNRMIFNVLQHSSIFVFLAFMIVSIYKPEINLGNIGNIFFIIFVTAIYSISNTIGVISGSIYKNIKRKRE